jgi:hypothetical protein
MIGGSHSGSYEVLCVLGYSDVWLGESLHDVSEELKTFILRVQD